SVSWRVRKSRFMWSNLDECNEARHWLYLPGMRYACWIFVLSFGLIQPSATAQNKLGEPLLFDFRLVVDNDAFSGDLTRDQYYSSGIYPAMRMLADSSARSRNVLSWQLNHRIY